MKKGAKTHAQSERAEKQKGHQPKNQSQVTASYDLSNLAQTGSQQLSPDNVLALQQTIGNRAVERLLEHRPDEDELAFPGPRTISLREYGGRQRGGSDLRSSTSQRGFKLVGDFGDAVDLDGDGLYGWDREIGASDVATVVNALIAGQSSDESKETERVFIYSGTHGTETGNLVDIGASGFIGEDQATAEKANKNGKGLKFEVVDVHAYGSREALARVFGNKNYKRILGWCFSKRSYKNRKTLKSNWWPEPDKLGA